LHQFIYGGWSDGDHVVDRTLDDFYELNLETKEWNPVKYEGKWPGKRRSHMMINHKDVEFILYGGFDGTRFLDDIWCFDVDKSKWREIIIKDNIPSGRRYFSFSRTNEGIYIFGGMTSADVVEDIDDDVKLNDEFYLLCDASEKYLFLQNLKKSKDFTDTLFLFNK
jgi:N-acetylneuraminic acid mutarotase